VKQLFVIKYWCPAAGLLSCILVVDKRACAIRGIAGQRVLASAVLGAVCSADQPAMPLLASAMACHTAAVAVMVKV
jgi:hypothetical protein